MTLDNGGVVVDAITSPPLHQYHHCTISIHIYLLDANQSRIVKLGKRTGARLK